MLPSDRNAVRKCRQLVLFLCTIFKKQCFFKFSNTQRIPYTRVVCSVLTTRPNWARSARSTLDFGAKGLKVSRSQGLRVSGSQGLKVSRSLGEGGEGVEGEWDL